MNNIYAINGDNPIRMTTDLLETMEVPLPINKNALIVIKPNLVVASPSFNGATTHSEIVEGLFSTFRT